jgi:flagellar biosynthesis anti-sigma factor FlgM
MEIGKVSAYGVQSDQKVKTRGTGGAPVQSGALAPSGAASSESDRVEFSKGYVEMAQTRKGVSTEGDVRPDKVAQYRSLIESGAYMVDPDKVASKMMESGW